MVGPAKEQKYGKNARKEGGEEEEEGKDGSEEEQGEDKDKERSEPAVVKEEAAAPASEDPSEEDDDGEGEDDDGGRKRLTSKETLWRPHQVKGRKLLQKSLLWTLRAWPWRKMKRDKKKMSLLKKHLKSQRRQ